MKSAILKNAADHGLENSCRRKFLRAFAPSLVLAAALAALAPVMFAQTSAAITPQSNVSTNAKELYTQIKSFSLSGGTATVSSLVLNRDRAQITFTGTFYFATPVNGRVTGAVFVGDGTFTAQVPPGGFEKENVKRLLGADVVDSTFKTAVLRFSDDTFEKLGQPPAAAPVDQNILKLARDTEARILKETGANLSARLALSILNQEKPGFFFASFDGGKRGRFNLVLDYQTRLPVANFSVNGGEIGLIFEYLSDFYSTEIWMGFYGENDYKRGTVDYSDLNNLIDVKHYDLDLDLREHKKYVRLRTHLEGESKVANLRAIPFQIGENLGEFESHRLKKQMRLQRVRSGGNDLAFAQEDWEGGFTVFLPGETTIGQKLDLDLVLEGDFMYDPDTFCDCHYPRSNESWFPRHGYLDRATYSLTYRHPKKLRIASVGLRTSEELDPEIKDVMVTKYKIDQPIPLVTFALAPYERHAQQVRFDQGGVGDPITVEFNSLPGSYAPIKEDFILAELDNSLRYFTAIFGKYPYPVFSAAYHPFGFGQGFPSLLMIPPTDKANRRTYLFIAHETAHQWWGDIVSWRSYRDQWLSEGFAQYSGMLYAGFRSGPDAREEFIDQARSSLKLPPRNLNGVGKGRLVEVGPIILGHRLNTSKTLGAYQTLIYNKGALVLRMLHFLFTDPNTGNGDAFFTMMTDFVNRHRNGFASTDDFRFVANEHFARTPIARGHGLQDLNWFFRQWVYQSDLPSYQVEYQFKEEPGGKVIISGTISQENAPENWVMVLPLALTFGGKQTGYTTVLVNGPKSPFAIRLPSKPSKVELDPKHWVLSEKTSTKEN